MSLRQKTASSLRMLGKLPSIKQLLVATDGGQQVTCELTCLESLACEFNRLTFASDILTAATPIDLAQLSKDLSDRLTYLLEPIRPIEFDAELFVVQMRSAPPQRADEGTTYFELIVRRGELELCRYSKHAGSERRIIPTQVTREVLLKLVGDVESALHGLETRSTVLP